MCITYLNQIIFPFYYRSLKQHRKNRNRSSDDMLALIYICVCVFFTAQEMNIVGAASSSRDSDDDVEQTWSPGTLKYYGRAELKTSDHR